MEKVIIRLFASFSPHKRPVLFAHGKRSGRGFPAPVPTLEYRYKRHLHPVFDHVPQPSGNPLDCRITGVFERPAGYILNNYNLLPELYAVAFGVYLLQEFQKFVIFLLVGYYRVVDICVYPHTSPNLSVSHSVITTSASWVYRPFSLAWSIAPASDVNTPKNTRLALVLYMSV